MNNKYDAKMFVKVAEKINAEKQLKFFRSKVNLLKVKQLLLVVMVTLSVFFID